MFRGPNTRARGRIVLQMRRSSFTEFRHQRDFIQLNWSKNAYDNFPHNRNISRINNNRLLKIHGEIEPLVASLTASGSRFCRDLDTVHGLENNGIFCSSILSPSFPTSFSFSCPLFVFQVLKFLILYLL